MLTKDECEFLIDLFDDWSREFGVVDDFTARMLDTILVKVSASQYSEVRDDFYQWNLEETRKTQARLAALEQECSDKQFYEAYNNSIQEKEGD